MTVQNMNGHLLELLAGDKMNTYTFIITSLIIILIPGTGVIYTITVGLTEGKEKSIFAALGCMIGILPHLCISIALSSLLMQINDTVFDIIKYVGAVYLIFLGLGMICSKNNIQFSEMQTTHYIPVIISRGVLINLLNPKLTLFFFAFLPQYVASDSKHYMITSALLGALFMVLTLAVFIGYGFMGSIAKVWMNQSPKRVAILQKCVGLIFITFAVQLVLG